MGPIKQELSTEAAWSEAGGPLHLHDMGRFDGIRLHLLDESARGPAQTLGAVLDQATLVHPYAETLLVACDARVHAATEAKLRAARSSFRRVFLVSEGDDEGTAPRPLAPGICAVDVSSESVREARTILEGLPLGEPTWHAATALAAFWLYTPHVGRSALLALRGVATASTLKVA